jgi:hypothetical protein
MPSPLDGILASITEYVGDDKAKARELADALKKKDEDGNPEDPALYLVAQRLMTSGASATKNESTKEIKRLTQELADATKAREDAEQAVADAEATKGKPSANEEMLAGKLKRAEKERDDAKALAEQARLARIGDKVELSRARFRSSLKGQVDEFGLDALDRRFADRFKPADDGTVQVLDGEGDPIEAPKGKSPEDVLAEEALAAVPASNRLRPMNGGGGAGGPGGAAGTITVDQIVAEKQQTREFGTRF